MMSVFAVNEAYTMKTCYNGLVNTVVDGGYFRCDGCWLKYNRGLNEAVNIGKRFFGYMLKIGERVNLLQSSERIVFRNETYQKLDM